MPMITNLKNDLMPLHYIFCNHSVLVVDSEKLEFPSEEIVQKCFDHQVVIDWFGELEYQYTAIALEDDCPAPSGCKWISIRSLFDNQDTNNEQIQFAARAHSLIKWRKKKRYCPQCGSLMLDDKYETARFCPKCQKKLYPQVTPVVVALVEKDDEILLEKSVDRNHDVYTCFAGFIEPGESAEQCVRRVIKEDVGLDVTNIRYATSQVWPFPDQLMLSFKATFDGGEIEIQNDEIEEVKWFKKNALPSIPKKGSIVYKLITGEI